MTAKDIHPDLHGNRQSIIWLCIYIHIMKLLKYLACLTMREGHSSKAFESQEVAVIWLDSFKRGMWCTCHTRDYCFQRPRDHTLPSSSWLIYPLTGRMLWARAQCSVVCICVWFVPSASLTVFKRNSACESYGTVLKMLNLCAHMNKGANLACHVLIPLLSLYLHVYCPNL